MKAVVAAFNQEKALVGAFSVITNLRVDLFESLIAGDTVGAESKAAVAKTLFGSSKAAPWLTAEEEAAVVTGFLTAEDKLGLSVDLMRFFLDTLHSLETAGYQAEASVKPSADQSEPNKKSVDQSEVSVKSDDQPEVNMELDNQSEDNHSDLSEESVKPEANMKSNNNQSDVSAKSGDDQSEAVVKSCDLTGRRRQLPVNLTGLVGELYSTWRQHWGYQLEYTRPEEPLTQQCIRSMSRYFYIPFKYFSPGTTSWATSVWWRISRPRARPSRIK